MTVEGDVKALTSIDVKTFKYATLLDVKIQRYRERCRECFRERYRKAILYEGTLYEELVHRYSSLTSSTRSPSRAAWQEQHRRKPVAQHVGTHGFFRACHEHPYAMGACAVVGPRIRCWPTYPPGTVADAARRMQLACEHAGCNNKDFSNKMKQRSTCRISRHIASAILPLPS